MRCKRESPIVEFARSVRAEDPGIGARKIWLMASDVFGNQMIGRDALYALLEREGMRLRRPRPRHTTNSNHRYHINFTLGREVIQTNRLLNTQCF